MQLVFVLLAIGVIAIVFNSWVSTKRKGKSELVREEGPEPDYTFEGQFYIFRQEAARKGGDYGVKLLLALYKELRFVRLNFYLKKKWVTHDIRFDEIEGVEREVHPAGVYGTYQVHLIVITTNSENFPQREILIHPGEYKLLDALSDALRKPEKEVATEPT